MRTRLVKVRRRPAGVWWAVLFLMLSMAAYIKVSVPSLEKWRMQEIQGADTGERVTGEVVIGPMCIYLVSFGGYDVLNSAKVEAARYVPRGAAGYVLKREKLYVIGAGYGQREAAERACVSLAAQEGLACAVIEAFSPQVVMRMTAGSAQIEAFVQAEKTLRESAELAGALAFSVDRGETALFQAQGVVASCLEKLLLAQEVLTAQAGDSQSSVFRGMGSLLSEMREQMEAMLEEDSKMEFSSRLKYAHIDLTVREIEMMNALMR